MRWRAANEGQAKREPLTYPSLPTYPYLTYLNIMAPRWGLCA